MTRRQNNNQWSGDVTAHTAPKNSESKNPVEKSSPQFFGGDQDGILLIDYLPKGQTINSEYYSSLLVQLKDIFKEKCRGKFTKMVLFFSRQCPGSSGTCNPEETGLPGLPVSWSPTLFSGSCPVRLSPVPWTEKNNWKVAIFRPMRRSLLPWRPGWTDNFLIFFIGLQSQSKGLRSVLSFVGSMLNKSRVWLL